MNEVNLAGRLTYAVAGQVDRWVRPHPCSVMYGAGSWPLGAQVTNEFALQTDATTSDSCPVLLGHELAYLPLLSDRRLHLLHKDGSMFHVGF
jgi:hypothetical protein